MKVTSNSISPMIVVAVGVMVAILVPDPVGLSKAVIVAAPVGRVLIVIECKIPGPCVLIVVVVLVVIF
jgi:hypothetical protein